MTRFPLLADLQLLTGQTLGTSDWLPIDQSRIDAFAGATGDSQWVHVDPVRARAGPFGTPIAHGFLTLSLMPSLLATAFAIDDVVLTINYGLNRVRFPAVLPAGSLLQANFKLMTFAPIPRGAQLCLEMSAYRAGHPKPVCVAEAVLQHFVSQN